MDNLYLCARSKKQLPVQSATSETMMIKIQ